MDERYQNVSLRLYQVLDWIGASEKMRGIYRETSIIDETLSTVYARVLSGGQTIDFTFGSSVEGTTTLGLHSDSDKLTCADTLVVERICDALQDGLSLLMVTDDTTKPGYVKLQIVIGGVAQTINHRETTIVDAPDHLGRTCLKQCAHVIYPIGFDETEINGPALTTKFGFAGDMDSLLAFRFQCIPNFARSWISRKRMYNWPHPDIINHMKDYGCFLVGVNHPSSQNGPIEWRLSFSLQERFLMFSLNSTQHKCYILLKMIKTDILHTQAPKSISSYHCKTCLFYAIENTPCALWTRNKLMECLLTCMRLLLHWVKEHNCPNYFIPNENMFDKLEDTTLSRVQTVLEDMVDHWCRFIWSITCDDIGNILYDVLFVCGPGMMQIRNERTDLKIARLYICRLKMLQSYTRTILWHTRCQSSYDILSVLRVFKGKLSQLNALREYTAEQTEIATTNINAELNLQTAQSLASIMLTIRDEGRMRTVFDKFMYYIAASKDFFLLSPYLINASYCLQSGRFDTCENVLLECETLLMHKVASVCSCQITLADTMNELFQQLSHKQAMPFRQFVRTCVIGCICFLPCEANLVTQALHLEMYRSVNTSLQYRNMVLEYCSCSIVVDSKVYLYFLQYVLYSKTNKPINKKDAIDNLVYVINTDRCLGHRETAYNLLGWIYSQENRIHEALMCFFTSWRIRPNHNAAKWHVVLLIYHRSTHRNVSNYYGINTH